MRFQTIELAFAERIATITLNVPERLNALSGEMLHELNVAIDRIESEPDVRAVVVTGRGRAFCAGADLTGVASGDIATERPFLERVQSTLHRVRTLPMPVIAALNGITMGGGLELAMHCDIIVAADDAKIADAHANVGVLPGAGGCTLLPRLVGPVMAKYMVFSGEAVPAHDLQRLGLLAKLFPNAELQEGARALALRLAEKSPLGLRQMKRLIDQGLEQANLQTALGMELSANALHAHSFDYAEGIAAFNERRKANFTGR